MGMMWAASLEEVPEVLSVRPDLRELMLDHLFKEKVVDPDRKDQSLPWGALVELLEGDIGLEEAVGSVGTDKASSCRVKCVYARIYNQAVLDSMESMGLTRAVVSANGPEGIASASRFAGKGFSITSLRMLLGGGSGGPLPDCPVKGNPLCRFVVMPVTGG